MGLKKIRISQVKLIQNRNINKEELLKDIWHKVKKYTFRNHGSRVYLTLLPSLDSIDKDNQLTKSIIHNSYILVDISLLNRNSETWTDISI
jgi:hypothetical protein